MKIKFKGRTDNWESFIYNRTDQVRSLKADIVQTSLFLKEGSKFWLPRPEGESKNYKKGGESMVQGQVLLKKGGGLTLFLITF